jgi:hypothetical protein
VVGEGKLSRYYKKMFYEWAAHFPVPTQGKVDKGGPQSVIFQYSHPSRQAEKSKEVVTLS